VANPRSSVGGFFRRRGPPAPRAIGGFTSKDAWERPNRQPSQKNTSQLPAQCFCARRSPGDGETSRLAAPGCGGGGRGGGFGRDRSVTMRAYWEAVGIARIAKETRLTRQTIYQIRHDPASAEAALAAWGCSRRYATIRCGYPFFFARSGRTNAEHGV
jgi:hypothetical protein